MSKAKPEVKAVVLKGQQAEDRVLAYIKRMNRPYGAVDVAANLKGTVPKTAAQKILVVLAERGDLVQKTYGKTTFFAPNQARVEAPPPDQLAEAEKECTALEEANAVLAARVKATTSELAKIKSTPTDAALADQIAAAMTTKAALEARLAPLRSGAPLVDAGALAALDADWTRWRAEWIRRRKVFDTFWALATDALPPQDAVALGEDLGVERDSDEHAALERGSLCALPARGGRRR